MYFFQMVKYWYFIHAHNLGAEVEIMKVFHICTDT